MRARRSELFNLYKYRKNLELEYEDKKQAHELMNSQVETRRVKYVLGKIDAIIDMLDDLMRWEATLYKQQH